MPLQTRSATRHLHEIAAGRRVYRRRDYQRVSHEEHTHELYQSRRNAGRTWEGLEEREQNEAVFELWPQQKKNVTVPTVRQPGMPRDPSVPSTPWTQRNSMVHASPQSPLFCYHRLLALPDLPSKSASSASALAPLLARRPRYPQDMMHDALMHWFPAPPPASRRSIVCPDPNGEN